MISRRELFKKSVQLAVFIATPSVLANIPKVTPEYVSKHAGTPVFATANISDILATTLESRAEKIADNVTNNNALLMKLKK